MGFEQQFIESVSKLMARDLSKLEDEISCYPDEGSIWKISGEIKNSAGNLCLHVCGNLQHYIGANLGHSDYIRDRENEFAGKNIPKSKLVAEIQETKRIVIKTLGAYDLKIIGEEYPERVFDHQMTTMHFLIHLQAHLGYHLGQVNYHRRLLIK
jgi:hypothetical protein